MYEDIACAGLLARAKGVRIRGVFVDPAFRRMGVGTVLTEQLIQLAQFEGWAYIEAYAWAPAWYIAHNFELVGRNAHGASLMRRQLPKPD